MTEIKTNKLTKETGKENREGKMKEDVQMTDAENKTGAEAGTQPKKKNISAVFRPQNSKTGMVKPGSRPQDRTQINRRMRQKYRQRQQMRRKRAHR